MIPGFYDVNIRSLLTKLLQKTPSVGFLKKNNKNEKYKKIKV